MDNKDQTYPEKAKSHIKKQINFRNGNKKVNLSYKFSNKTYL